MANMANKCCCCSSVLPCFSCISARKNHTSPSSAHTSPSSAPPDSSLDAGPFSVADASTASAAPSGGGFSSSTVQKMSEFSVADSSTSAAPSGGGSSSSTIQKTSDLNATMYKDAGGLPRENADLDDLIGHISQLLELIEAGKIPFQGNPWAQSYLPTSESYIKLKDFLSERLTVDKDVNPSVAIKTVVSDVLQGMEIEHMVTTCFVVAANIAEKFKGVGDNKNECLTLLREMFSLAKHLRQFQERPPLMKTEKITAVIKEVTELIVEGSILCSTRIKFSQFKFWAASVNKQELSKFTQKLREMYTVDEGNVDLDGLIKHISQLFDFIKANNSSLKLHGKAQEYFPTTSKIFSKLKKFLFDINDVIVGESIKRAVSDALKGMDAADLVTADFVVVANILERFEDVRHNKNDCMLLLEEMISLAKLVKQFRERPELKTEGIIAVIKEPTELIVESSIVCCSQMTFSKFSKFEAVSNQEELSKFRQKLRDMYTRMNSLDGGNVQIDGLINHISQLVCIIEGKHASLQQRRALEYLPTASKILPKLKEFLDGAKDVSKDHTIKTTVSDVLEGMGVKDLVTTGLVVYATILERFQDFKVNRNECINLLKEMFTLAKTIKKFEERPKYDESEEISDAIKKTTESIVEGSILCYSHMESSKFYKLWEESMIKEALSKFRENLSSMLMDMNTMPDLIDVDGLISHISQLFELIEAKHSSRQIQRRAQECLPTTSEIFSKIKKFLFDAKDVIPGEAIKTMVNVALKGMGASDLVTTPFVVIATILERFEDVGDNEDDCINFLNEMFVLAKLVKQFRERRQLKETQEITDVIKEATGLIVEGSIVCCTQMKASKFSKFWSASGNKEEMSKFRQKLKDMYTHMNAQMGIRLYDVSAPKKPRLSRGYPEHAVGMEKAVQRVLQLLEWESDQKAVAVMLHAFGGMGKTTLGDAVFSKADFEGCKYSEIRLFEHIGSTPNIMELQKCILKDLTGPEETIPDIRTYESGQRELGKILKDVPAFIYIDNVLGEKELMQLLPKDFDTSKKVRLLLTARDSNVGRAFPRKTSFKIHSMENISKEDAMKFLKREVLDDIEGKLNSTQIHDIIEVCGGVPLMLTLVAKVLRFEDDTQKGYNMVMKDKQNVKGLTYDGKEDYFFAYDSLPEKCRDPFLDVCSFFKGMEWNRLADIVGEFELDTLQKRSLVTKDINGNAFVHDVILTIGHQKAEGTRLTSAIQFHEFLHHGEDKDNQGMTGIKGIDLSENKDPLTLSASTLDSMCKSLRVLRLGSLTKVEGQCNKVFVNLLFFQGEITHLPFHRMSQLKDLRCLDYEPQDLTLPKMPSSLRIMQFDGKLSSPAFQIPSTCLQQLKNLRILKLINFIKLKKLPEDIGDQVKDLQDLNLSNCKSLEELPRSVSKLQSLRHLTLDNCSSLRELPEDFGSLKSLQSLQLQGCLSLRQLGKDFGSLNSLQLLNLNGCTGLKALPNNFEKLSSLRELDLSSCEDLEDLPHGLGNLSSLVTLGGFPDCHKLRSVPDTIGQLKLTGSMMDMSDCSSLTELPDGFCNFLWIIQLDMSECKSLERLPKRFGELTNLKMLILGGCNSLRRLPEGFGQLKYLEILNLSRCKSLEELCNDFHYLKSLHYLCLNMCKSLKKLPEDFHCLISLRVLVLKCCAVLEGKSMDSLIKIKTLQNLDIAGSGMVLDRWAEIQRESDQPWPFTVLTGQDISTEEKEDKEKNMLSQLQFLLSEGREKPFHLSHPHLLLVLDYSTEFNQNFPWLLIEETIDDIQIDFEMVYIGSHFDKLPPKAKNIIAGHVDDPFKGNVFNLLVQMAEILDEKNDLNIIQMSMLEDGAGVQCRPCWKRLTSRQTEEFLLCRCGKYLQLKKQLVETSPESPVNLLTELFATGEDQTCTFQKAPTGNSKPLTCKAEELKGKTIVLEMRPLDVCYDVHLESLSQLYNTLKNTCNLEIISIPLAHRSTRRHLHAVEQFSRGIPWLVFQNPWAIPIAVKYFLIKMLSPDEEEIWSSSRIKIIEPDGRIFTASKPVLSLLDTWGAKAYPFSVQKIKELKEEEWNQMETMSTVEFLFKHLESVYPHQVKEMMLPSKVVCLYGGIRSENMMKEFMCSIQNAFMRVRDTIHIIYFPSIILKDVESIPITDNLVIPHRKISPFPQPHPEMEGMLLLNLSVHDSFRFWRRLYFMRNEMPEMYKRDIDHLDVMKKLIQCRKVEDNVNPWIILIDEEGKMITEKGREIVLACTSSMEDKAKGWTELLIKGSKEQRKQALLKFRARRRSIGSMVSKPGNEALVRKTW